MRGIHAALVKWAYYQYVGAAMTVFSRYPIGTNVFEFKWDALIVLDTCRVDALREVAPEYDFLDTKRIGSIVSVGSGSSEWIANTFVDDYQDTLADTVYVSANGYAQKVLQDRDFPDTGRGLSWSEWRTVTDQELLALDQPWQYAPAEDHGHTRPRYVTERGITLARDLDPERLVLHYSQPHAPYTAQADAEDREQLYPYESDPWTFLRNGGERETVWTGYLDNLRLVLDDIELLLCNLDADTVAITADHGEAFGEYGVYRHPLGLPHPKTKRVPWTTTTAEDTETHEPSFGSDRERKDMTQHLVEMGYQ